MPYLFQPVQVRVIYRLLKNTPVPQIVYESRIYYPLLYRSILSRYSIYRKSPLALALTVHFLISFLAIILYCFSTN